jgi:hypothetical protein
MIEDRMSPRDERFPFTPNQTPGPAAGVTSEILLRDNLLAYRGAEFVAPLELR